MKQAKMNTLIRLTVAFLAILALTFSACTNDKEPQVIKIGAILPLTGPIAFFGEYEKNAINIACSEINDRGGIKGKKVEVIYEDSQNDPKKAVNAFNKLISSIC